MMVRTIFRCMNCGFVIEVRGDSERLSLIRGTCSEHACPTCNERKLTTVIFSNFDEEFVDKVCLTPSEFWIAASGGGFPNELVTQKETLESLLLANRIIEADISEIDNRCIVRKLTLDNGVILHFGSSGYGAFVVKATRRKDASKNSSGSDTESNKPKNDEVSKDAAPSGADEPIPG